MRIGVLFTCLFLVGASVAQVPRYRVVDLTAQYRLSLGCGLTDLNNHGSIVGAQNGTGFLIENGILTVLPKPKGALECWPYQINDNGVVLGTGIYGGGHSPEVSLIWLHQGVVFPNVAPAVGSGSGAPLQALNNRGDFVGRDHGTAQAIRWSFALGLRYLPSGPGPSAATSINDNGIVAGMVLVGSNRRAYRWTGGHPQSLHPDGFRETQAHAISNEGTIGGEAVSSLGRYTAVVWRLGTEFVDCGALTDTGWSFFNDINNHGQVVGYSNIDQRLAGFLWEDGRMYNLDHLVDPGLRINFTTATHINDQGWILAAGSRENQPRRFLLIPSR